MFRRLPGSGLELLIAHPGGPLHASKDLGRWTVPKGEYEPGEDALATAAREFTEEMGQVPPDGPRIDLGEVRLKSGKRVRCFAVEGDLDASSVVSNLFEMEWPPRSGRTERFPEIDRAEWVSPAVAREKLNPAQAAFVDRLEMLLGESPSWR